VESQLSLEVKFKNEEWFQENKFRLPPSSSSKNNQVPNVFAK